MIHIIQLENKEMVISAETCAPVLACTSRMIAFEVLAKEIYMRTSRHDFDRNPPFSKMFTPHGLARRITRTMYRTVSYNRNNASGINQDIYPYRASIWNVLVMMLDISRSTFNIRKLQ